MQKMIVSDLDGTLLDTEHKVDAFTAATFQALAAQGVHIAIATGRHFLDVKGIRESLGVSAHLITSNGARVHDPENNEIFAENLNSELAKALMQPEFSAGTLLNAYLDEGWFVERTCPELLELYCKDSDFKYQVINLQQHDGIGIAKILYIADHVTLTAVENKIIERFGDEVYITFSADDCLEIMAPTVSKGHALTEVLGRLKIDAAHCYAFGDGQNDIQLLAVAGNPFIMSNASPKLKIAFPNAPIIGSNNEHGVAQQLRKIFEF